MEHSEERERAADIVLIAGLWLDTGVWDRVAAELRRLGHRPHPVALPGQDDGAADGAADNAADATLADQVAAVVAAVDGLPGRATVVGHSAASSLAWLAADARPERVAQAVFIGGFPTEDGRAYADFFEVRDGVMPFPGWGPFEGPDSADLDEPTKEAVAAAAIPVPQQVAQGVVRLTDERRYAVPAVVVCPEFSPEQAQEWIDKGEVPELARARQVELVDLDSGHWPMFSRPEELARVLAEIASASR